MRSERVLETMYPLTIVDDAGRSIEIGIQPERMISLSPGNTEILFALGLGEKVVGVTNYCDYPEEAKEKPKVGGFSTISIEKIVSLEPDLVLATGGVQRQIVDRLESIGIKTLVVSPETVEEIIKDIELIGRIANKNDEAEVLVENLRSRIEDVSTKIQQTTSRPKVYYEIWHNPLMSIGEGTWIDELIGLAGGRNIFSGSSDPYPMVNSELIIQRDPEIIIIKRGYMGGAAKEDILARPGWQEISAVRDGRIYEIDEDILIRPGPRIVDGLEILAIAIHPQLFT